MMRASADPKATSNTILVLACVLLAGSVAGLVLKKPDAKAAVAKEKRDAVSELLKAETAKSETDAAQRTVDAQMWAGDPAAITGDIVNLTATLAKRRGVQWVRLQPPSKATSGGPLEEYTYLLVVQGAFPKVAALERDLEVPANRLAVNSFQVASSGSDTNDVSASIGIVAHRVPPQTDVEDKDKKNAKGP